MERGQTVRYANRLDQQCRADHLESERRAAGWRAASGSLQTRQAASDHNGSGRQLGILEHETVRASTIHFGNLWIFLKTILAADTW
jgi:hypothetical protein